MKARTPIRRVSVKHAKELREYAKLRKEFMELNDLCYATHILRRCGHYDCQRWASDLHHVQGRGKNLLRTETWIAVCRSCHQFIHDHPRQAREVGLLL